MTSSSQERTSLWPVLQMSRPCSNILGRSSLYPLYSYIIDHGVVYLCICERNYPRKLAFTYLDDLSKEFFMSYGNEIDRPGLRPYAFARFGTSNTFFAASHCVVWATTLFVLTKALLCLDRYVHAKHKAIVSGYQDTVEPDKVARGSTGCDQDHDQEHGGSVIQVQGSIVGYM